jgi:hypothetical protein
MTTRCWRNGGLALGLLGLPAAGRAQGWPLQAGPSGDAVTRAATAPERLRPAAATSRPDPLPLPSGRAGPRRAVAPRRPSPARAGEAPTEASARSRPGWPSASSGCRRCSAISRRIGVWSRHGGGQAAAR